MHLWFKRCAETSAGNAFWRKTILPINTISRAGIQCDFSGLVSHRHNVFVVHHVTCCGVAAEVKLKNKNENIFTPQSFLIVLFMNELPKKNMNSNKQLPE